MAVLPDDVDNVTARLDRLNGIRLTRDWSYRELSKDIERVTGMVVSAQTLQPLLQGRYSRPYDRTLYKIRRYFELLDAPPAKPARKAKGRAA